MADAGGLSHRARRPRPLRSGFPPGAAAAAAAAAAGAGGAAWERREIYFFFLFGLIFTSLSCSYRLIRNKPAGAWTSTPISK